MIPTTVSTMIPTIIPSILAVLLLGAISGCSVDLVHELPERQANQVVVLLRGSGIVADKKLEQRGVGTRQSLYVVTVPPADETRALGLLGQLGLPTQTAGPTEKSSKLLPLPEERRAEAAAELSRSIENTLESLPEVLEARVHLALPEPEPLQPLGALRPTSSVLLRLKAPLLASSKDLAELVAKAVPGLDPRDVSIVTAVVTLPPTSAAPLARESRGVVAALGALVLLLSGVCALLARNLWPRRKAAPPPPTATTTATALASKI